MTGKREAISLTRFIAFQLLCVSTCMDAALLARPNGRFLQQPVLFAAKSAEEVDNPISRMPVRCPGKIQIPGFYLFEAIASESKSCEVFVQAPPRFYIRLSFSQLNIDEQTSRLHFIDGFVIQYRFGGKPGFIPEVDDVMRRLHNVYQLSAASTGTILQLNSSQNYAQLMYSMRPGEGFRARIEFLPDSSDYGLCNDMLQPGIFKEGQLTLTTDGYVSSCKVYVVGGIAVSLVSRSIEQSETSCDESSIIAVRGSGRGWNKESPTVTACKINEKCDESANEQRTRAL